MNIYEALNEGADAMRQQGPHAYMAHSYLLSVAAALGGTQRLQVLVEQGATSWAELNHAMAVAAERGASIAVEYLHSHGADDATRALFVAARRGHVDVVEYFHIKGHSLAGVWFWAKKGRHGKLMNYLYGNGIPDDSGFTQD